MTDATTFENPPWELAVGPPPESLGRLGRARRPGGLARARRAPLPLRSDDLLQLRVGLRAARVRRQGDSGENPQVRGQPVAPGQPRPNLRQGAGDDQPGPRPGAHPAPAQARGSARLGQFEPVTWDEALADIGGRIRRAFDEGRHDEIMYHVGRPGDDHFVPRCSDRLGRRRAQQPHQRLQRVGATRLRAVVRRRPPVSRLRQRQVHPAALAHLETGHYFNPHAQRIIEAKRAARASPWSTPRLSNTATHADHWISDLAGQRGGAAARRGARAARRGRFDREFVRRWTNWEEYLEASDPARDPAASSASSNC